MPIPVVVVVGGFVWRLLGVVVAVSVHLVSSLLVVVVFLGHVQVLGLFFGNDAFHI